MPYRLRKSPKRDLYWVIGEDGTKHSKEPLPKERAEKQMKALYIAMRQKRALKGGIKHPKKFVYDEADSGSESGSDIDMETAEQNAPNILMMIKETEVEPPPKRRRRGEEQELSEDALAALDAMGLPQAGRSPPTLNEFSRVVPDSPGAKGRKPTKSREPPAPAGRRHKYINAYEESPKRGRGKHGGVAIPKKEFVKEHVRLIDLLKSGSPLQRMREARDQAKELAMKGKGVCSSRPERVVAPTPITSSRTVSGEVFVRYPTDPKPLVDDEPPVPAPPPPPAPKPAPKTAAKPVAKPRWRGGGYKRIRQDVIDLVHRKKRFSQMSPETLKMLEQIQLTRLPNGRMGSLFSVWENMKGSIADKDYGVDFFLHQFPDALAILKHNYRTNPDTYQEEGFPPAPRHEIENEPAYFDAAEEEYNRLPDTVRTSVDMTSAYDDPIMYTGRGKDEDAARLISMFEEMKRKLEEAREPEPAPEVPDEDEETALQPRISVHRPTSAGYDTIQRMMKPNESGELKKEKTKPSEKTKEEAKAFAEELRSAGLEERGPQSLPLNLELADKRDMVLRGLFIPQKGDTVTQESIDDKIRLLRNHVFEVGSPSVGVYSYRLEDLIPQLKYEATIKKKDLRELILISAEELTRARLTQFPDYVPSVKYMGYSGRGKSPYETADVAKMMETARRRRNEMAEGRRQQRELEATMENYGAFMKRAIANRMTPMYLAEVVVAKPYLFTEMTLNRAKYMLKMTGKGYHGGSKEDWVVILNKFLADLKKSTGSNISDLGYYSALSGLVDKMSYPEFDNMTNWLSDWKRKNDNGTGKYNIDALMSRLKDFWNSPLAGTFAVKPVTSPVKSLAEISEAIPENLKAWIDKKQKMKAERDMKYMTTAQRLEALARAEAATDRSMVELADATAAAKLRREDPDEANRREAERKAQEDADKAARLRQFALDTKKRIAESNRFGRFRQKGYF